MRLILIKSKPMLLNIKEHVPLLKFNKSYFFSFLAILALVASVSAASIYLFNSKTHFTMGAAVEVVKNLPDTVFGHSGDYYSYSLNFTNKANTAHNFTILYWINSSTINISSGDIMLRILDSDNSTTLSSASTVSNNAISLEVQNIQVNSSESKLLHPSVEFRPSAQEGNYDLNIQVVEGSYNFKS